MSLPEKGTIVHLSAAGESDLAQSVARALRAEFGHSRALIKTIGRWTGASDRAIKNWLAGGTVPSGYHLVALMRCSDAVMRVVLIAAGRQNMVSEAGGRGPVE